MKTHQSADVFQLLQAINNLLGFLHAHHVSTWDNKFARPIMELQEWGNHRAAITLLKKIPLGGMGGLLDQHYGNDQAVMDSLCTSFSDALDDLDEKIK